MREICRIEAGESRGPLILWMGIIEDVFHRKEKEFKTRKDGKCVKENPCQSEESALA